MADIWAEWVLDRRFGGDPEQLKATLAHLYPIRDRVLTNARLQDDGTLLDVGCGDGLIGFGALQRHPASRVVFADISQDLLERVRSIAEHSELTGRCDCLCASAEDLSSVTDASVDAVTTRSVLIYVADKRRAMGEFYRVLKPGGRLSVFEPINRFGEPQPAHMFWGFDATPIIEIAGKIKALYQHLQPLDADPMMNFDERDLISHAESAGFREIELDLRVEVKPISAAEDCKDLTWESYMRVAGNPRIPTLEEATAQVLTEDETAKFTAHMRPLVEGRTGTYRSALAYLSATK